MLRRFLSLACLSIVVLAGLTGLLAFTADVPGRGAPDTTVAGDSLSRRLAPWLGLSGNLRAVNPVEPTAPGATLADLLPGLRVSRPGIYPTGLAAPDGEPIHLLTPVPLSSKAGATWRGYRIGYWPGETRSGGSGRYLLPRGFFEVTPESRGIHVSKRFTLGDFLTHDQSSTWPKVLVLRLPLLDKLELIARELEAMGRPSSLRVMSGFRTPQYNALGVGPRGGRARNSRHMYGDAADVYVDADGNGQMDDLTHDGRVTIADAAWLAAVADRVEAVYPTLRGGIGVYQATSAHGPFVHVDVRGDRARW